jgi:DNA polymerase III subunit delta'
MSKETGLPESDRFEDAPHPREQTAFFGHAAAERELLEAYRANRMAQAWILGGPEGIGKATLAWRLARFLLAHPDPSSSEVQSAQSLWTAPESSAARHIATLALADIFLLRRSWNDKTKRHYTEIRIDDVREIIQALHRGSKTGGWRVAIVDCADDLNRSSANALLKLIEEPPERALFLLVAPQPGRILPTIRSRCRRLALQPVEKGDIAKAVKSLGPAWAGLPDALVAEAADRARGSVREALRLLDSDGVVFDRTVQNLFDRLPQIEWSAVHALADRLAGRDNESAYETFMRALHRFLDDRVHAQAGQGAGALIGYAEAWAEIGAAARETEVFNFDKKALVVSIFERLQRAARG